MSRSVDLFIRTDKAVDEVASALRSVSELTVEAGDQPGRWHVVHGEIRGELMAHPYVDDGDLDLTRYPYVITAPVSGSRQTDTPEAKLLRGIATYLHGAGYRTLLVHDLQYRDRPAAAATDVAVTVPGQP